MRQDMSTDAIARSLRVGYVVKRYPKYSETFIVSEILAHEAAGLELEIFSLRPPTDSHFQDGIWRVRAPVTYLPTDRTTYEDLVMLVRAGELSTGVPDVLAAFQDEDPEDIYQALLLASTVRLKNIGHLHAHFATVATTVTRMAARLAGVPFTFTTHAKDIFHRSVRADVLRTLMDDAKATVTISEYNALYLLRIWGGARERLRCIRNGLDLTLFGFEDPAERPPAIVAVGRFIEKKGFEYLIEACRILADRRMRFVCRVIGSGPLEPALRSAIDRLHLGDQIALVGPLPQTLVIQEIRQASVLAAPCVLAADSDRDGLPTVLLEAMALGTPCVSTDVTGIPEVLRDGETGLMVTQRDPVALAAALERLLTDATLRVTVARAARRLIEEKFDVVRNAALLRGLFAPIYAGSDVRLARVG